MKADSALGQDMQTVASAFARFVRREHRFPDEGREAVELAMRLARLLPDNPYYADQELGKCLKLEGKEGRAEQTVVHISQDLFLQSKVSQLLDGPPPESWQASPGTISIIHNGEDQFIVWGAGASGQAIKNQDSGQSLIIVRHTSR